MKVETLDRYIEITPGVAGGKPRLTGHRITVQNIAVWHEWCGWSVDEIASEYSLTLPEIHAALAFYYAHKSDIDAAITADEAFVEELRQKIKASDLR
jgi:uncharacterized protein (DUF433 family)